MPSRISPAMRTFVSFTSLLLRILLAFFRTRQEQAIVELALRQQLAAYAQKRPRPRLSPLDRAFWVAQYRFWPRWKNALVIVRPETVVRWHRQGFRRYWRSISTPEPGRPPVSKEVQELIVRMATENGQATLARSPARSPVTRRMFLSRVIPMALSTPAALPSGRRLETHRPRPFVYFHREEDAQREHPQTGQGR